MADLQIASPFASIPKLARIEAQDRTGPPIAQLLLRAGKRDDLARKLRETDGALIGLGPESWLWIAEGGRPDFINEVTAELSGMASIVDQTGAYGLIRLSGPLASEVLRHGPFIDFDPGVFAVGAAAVTSLAHIGVVVWRSGPEQYDIAVPRSYCADFLHWLETYG